MLIGQATNLANCRSYPGRRGARHMLSSEAFTLSVRRLGTSSSVQLGARRCTASAKASLDAVGRTTGPGQWRRLARARTEVPADGAHRSARRGALTSRSSRRWPSSAHVADVGAGAAQLRR
jgi:hypothetical protein